MRKRLLMVTLLFSALSFLSCSSKKDVAIPEENRAEAFVNDETIVSENAEVVVPDSEKQSLKSDGISYEDLKRRHYDMQSDATKKMMKENAKRSKRDTPLRKRSLFNFGNNKFCGVVNDAVIKDGVRDVK